MTRVLTLVFGFLGALAVAFLAVYYMLSYTPAKPKDTRFGASVQIGHDIYQFPRNAHDIFPDEGGRPECISLRIMFPEMEGLTRNNSVEMDGLTQDSGALRLLLCDSSHPDRPLTSRWTPLVYTGRVAAVDLNGTVEVPLPALEVLLEDFEQRDAFGAKEFVLKAGASSDVIGRRGLSKGDRKLGEIIDGAIATYVNCGNNITYVNPGCDMQFAFREVSVTSHFRLKLLPQWEAIRDQLNEYFESSLLKKQTQ